MPLRLTLISHAPTTATRAAAFPGDESLDDRGATRAAAGAVPRSDEVYSGPERRCAETAEALGLTPSTEPALRDLDVGDWRGRALTDVERSDPAGLHGWLTDPGGAPHGGESLRDLLKRVGGWLDGLADARIVAVTHPAVVRAVLVHALRMPEESFWRIDVAPLSQTKLSGAGGRWTLRETGHPLS